MNKKLKKQEIYIVFLSIVLISSLLLVEKNKYLVKDPWYKEKYEAAKITQAAFMEIKTEKLSRGIEIDPLSDINQIGIIGEEFNGITTTLGSLDAKRTSANPNFAAVIVGLLIDAGLKPGDNVAINFSSSFPALNIATLASCDVLELNPIIITSIGSSTWGGNNINFTYLDMEELLYKKGLIKNKSRAVSPGGQGDIGADMDQTVLGDIIERMKEYGKVIIMEENLKKNIEIRNNLYFKELDKVHCFINVGGNIVAFGDTTDSLNTPPGLLRNKEYEVTDKSGLVQQFNSKKIPIIQILNIKEMAHQYGLEIDPSYSPEVGDGDVYYTYTYPLKLIALIVTMAIISLLIYKKRTRIPYD